MLEESDDDMEELLQEDSIEVDEFLEPLPDITQLGYFVAWLCMFLALWQYVFSIPDNAMEHSFNKVPESIYSSTWSSKRHQK